MKKRLRFSLRGLFVFTTLVALGAYWWFALPTVRAKRFIAAIEQKQFDVADNMFSDTNDQFLAEMAERHDRFEISARIEQQVHDDIWSRDRLVIVDITHGTWNHAQKYSVKIISNNIGLEAPSTDFDFHVITL